MELREVAVVVNRTPDERWWKLRTSIRFIGRESVHVERLLRDDDFRSVFDNILSEVKEEVVGIIEQTLHPHTKT